MERRWGLSRPPINVSPVPHALRVGEWQVDPATNGLRRGGASVRVEPKVMDVLVALAGAAGEVVTREALLATVWAGTVVGDEALTQSVIKLRRALGDDPRTPAYIETIPKRGYRLIAPVVRESTREAKAIASQPGWRVAAAACGVATAIAMLAWLPPGPPPGDARLAARGEARSTSRDAQQRLLEGQEKLLVRGSIENDEARRLFREAIELDPTFARAYSGLAMTYALESRLGGEDASRRALELAETARLIDPAAPDVHWVLAFVQTQARHHDEAIASLARAIELDPGFADAYALLGGIHTYVGNPTASIPMLRRAMQLNPDGGYLYYLLLGRAYLFAGDVEQAIINLRAAVLRNPVDVETRAYLAAALSAAGESAGARWEGEEVLALKPDFNAREWLRRYPMTDGRQEQRLATLLASAGL